MHKRHPGEGNCSGDLLLEREEKLQLGHCLHLLHVCKYLNLVDCLSFLPFDVIVYSDVGFLILLYIQGCCEPYSCPVLFNLFSHRGGAYFWYQQPLLVISP